MTYLKHLLLTSVLLFSSVSLAADTLSEESVLRLIDNIQAAVRAEDADTFASYFSNDAVISVEMAAQGGTMKLDMAQYTEMLRQAWASPMESTYEVFDIEVALAADGQSATVTDVTVETLSMNGMTMKTRSEETLEVQLLDGEAKVVSLYGKISM